MIKRGLFILTVIMVVAGILSFAGTYIVDIKAFIESAVIRYETDFTVDTTLERWNLMLDSPLLMGRLWELYKFTPAYKVSLKDSDLYIVDPTGIKGYLFEIKSGTYDRIFYGRGTMKNWYIPFSLRGKALFLLHHTYSHNGVSVNLRIYGDKGDNVVMDLMLKAMSPILRRYINRRVMSNLSNLKIIIEDIEQNPEKISRSLHGQFLDDFSRLTSISVSKFTPVQDIVGLPTAGTRFKNHTPQ